MSAPAWMAELGLAAVPGDIDKHPLVKWGVWNDRPQTDDERAGLGHGSVWGFVTGQLYGIVVLDFDGAEGVNLATSLKLSPNVITGSGGWHVWFEAPDFPVKTCSGVRPGLDVRGEGGIVWCDGRSRKGEYRLQGTSLYLKDGAAARRIIELGLLPERTVYQGSADLGDWQGDGDGRPGALRVLRQQANNVAFAQPGTRNHTLNRAAFTVGGLVASGELDGDAARRVLLGAAIESNRDGLWPEVEMLKVIESALGSGMQSPWSAEPQIDEQGEVWLSVSDLPWRRNEV